MSEQGDYQDFYDREGEEKSDEATDIIESQAKQIESLQAREARLVEAYKKTYPYVNGPDPLHSEMMAPQSDPGWLAKKLDEAKAEGMRKAGKLVRNGYTALFLKREIEAEATRLSPDGGK